jgi:hypothetical protein
VEDDMKQMKCLVMMISLLGAAACSSTSDSPEPNPAGEKQQLVAKGDCTFEACGSMPSSYAGEAKVECTEAAGECSWSPPDPLDGVVSYAQCEESECPARPSVDCPAGTVRASQQCGNENNTGCAWSTVCVPPRETTPCADQHGCDSQPVAEIGIICQDESVGSFVCVTDGRSCYWERSCD